MATAKQKKSKLNSKAWSVNVATVFPLGDRQYRGLDR